MLLNEREQSTFAAIHQCRMCSGLKCRFDDWGGIKSEKKKKKKGGLLLIAVDSAVMLNSLAMSKAV